MKSDPRILRAREILVALDPMRVRGLSLPPALALMAKLIVLVLALRGYGHAAMPPRGVAFPAFFENLGSDTDWKNAATLLFFTGAILLFFNLRPRLGCALSGAALILATLANSGWFANSRLYPGCVLLLAGLWDGSTATVFAGRAQAVLLYFGAAINKVFDPDWWNGRYFEFWLREKLRVEWYARLADSLPPLSLSVFMGVATIALEIVIFVALLRRATWPLAFLAALTFHVAAFLVSGLDFGVFLYVGSLSLLVFAPRDFPRLSPRGGRLDTVRTLVGQPWLWAAIMAIFTLGDIVPLWTRQALAVIVTALAFALVLDRPDPRREAAVP